MLDGGNVFAVKLAPVTPGVGFLIFPAQTKPFPLITPFVLSAPIGHANPAFDDWMFTPPPTLFKLGSDTEEKVPVRSTLPPTEANCPKPSIEFMSGLLANSRFPAIDVSEGKLTFDTSALFKIDKEFWEFADVEAEPTV